MSSRTVRLTCVFKFSRTRTIGPSCTPRRPGGVRPRRSSPESSTGPPGRPPVWACWRLTDGKWWRTRTGARIFERLQAEVDAKGLSAWDVSVDSMMARAISTPTGPVKGGSAKGAPWRRVNRARRPRPRALAGRVDHQAALAPRSRTKAALAHGPAVHRPARDVYETPARRAVRGRADDAVRGQTVTALPDASRRHRCGIVGADEAGAWQAAIRPHNFLPQAHQSNRRSVPPLQTWSGLPVVGWAPPRTGGSHRPKGFRLCTPP